jgi:hypothetical protein
VNRAEAIHKGRDNDEDDEDDDDDETDEGETRNDCRHAPELVFSLSSPLVEGFDVDIALGADAARTTLGEVRE